VLPARKNRIPDKGYFGRHENEKTDDVFCGRSGGGGGHSGGIGVL
jgi:hypothetical protein